jgi:hypothetical protein
MRGRSENWEIWRIRGQFPGTIHALDEPNAMIDDRQRLFSPGTTSRLVLPAPVAAAPFHYLISGTRTNDDRIKSPINFPFPLTPLRAFPPRFLIDRLNLKRA